MKYFNVQGGNCIDLQKSRTVSMDATLLTMGKRELLAGVGVGNVDWRVHVRERC